MAAEKAILGEDQTVDLLSVVGMLRRRKWLIMLVTALGTATAAFVGAILLAFQRGPVTGFAFVSTTVIVVPALLVLAFKVWSKTRIGKAFLGELPTEAEVLPDDPRRGLMGRVGVTRVQDDVVAAERVLAADLRPHQPRPDDRHAHGS